MAVVHLLAPRPASAACAALPSDKGQASYSLSTPTTATYRVWTRLYPASAGNNGIYMQIDNTYCNVVIGHNNAIPANTFTWVDYGNAASSKINAALNAGAHTIILAGYDPNVSVDKVLFLSDPSCVPSGDGSNCTAAAPAAATQPSAGAAPLSGGLDLSKAAPALITLPATLPDGSTKVYKLDGKTITGKLDTTKLADGKHTLEEITTAPDGTVTVKKQIIKVENGWQYKVARAIQAHPYLTAAALALLVLGGVGSFLLFGPKHLWNVLQARLGGRAAGLGGPDPAPSYTKPVVTPRVVMPEPSAGPSVPPSDGPHL
jgi:hypothetical protein